MVSLTLLTGCLRSPPTAPTSVGPALSSVGRRLAPEWVVDEAGELTPVLSLAWSPAWDRLLVSYRWVDDPMEEALVVEDPAVAVDRSAVEVVWNLSVPSEVTLRDHVLTTVGVSVDAYDSHHLRAGTYEEILELGFHTGVEGHLYLDGTTVEIVDHLTARDLFERSGSPTGNLAGMVIEGPSL